MVRAVVQRSGLCPYIKILDILKLISLVFSVFQRIIKLSKPTKEWRPSIEKETGMAMKPVEPPPPYPGIDAVSDGKTDPIGFQNPGFDGSLPNMADDSTHL